MCIFPQRITGICSSLLTYLYPINKRVLGVIEIKNCNLAPCVERRTESTHDDEVVLYQQLLTSTSSRVSMGQMPEEQCKGTCTMHCRQTHVQANRPQSCKF